MPDSQPSSQRPWWVRFALWGHTSRGSARAAFWICLLTAAGCAAAAMLWRRYMVGMVGGAVLMLLGGWWHALAIAWVDRHGGWPTSKTP